jgi:phage/plasmid-associated DNA primase
LVETVKWAHDVPENRLAQLGYAMTKAGHLKAVSVGFIPTKMLTGGDSISARFMRQDFFEFLPSHKLILSTNHKPVIKGTDRGIWRRVRLVPWDVVPSSPDSTLKAKLIAEREGILAWCVQGCRLWQEHGLGTAGAIDAATSEYQDESDVLGSFLSTVTVRAHAARTGSHTLYDAYKRWCEGAGESPWTQRSFSRALGERGLKTVKSDGVMVFKGLGVLADWETGRKGGSGSENPVDSQMKNPSGVQPGNSSLKLPSSLSLPGLGEESLEDDDDEIPWGGR